MTVESCIQPCILLSITSQTAKTLNSHGLQHAQFLTDSCKSSIQAGILVSLGFLLIQHLAALLFHKSHPLSALNAILFLLSQAGKLPNGLALIITDRVNDLNLLHQLTSTTAGSSCLSSTQFAVCNLGINVSLLQLKFADLVCTVGDQSSATGIKLLICNLHPHVCTPHSI